MADQPEYDMSLLFPDSNNRVEPLKDIKEASPEALEWFDSLHPLTISLLYGTKEVSPGEKEYGYIIDKQYREARRKTDE